MCLTWLLDLKDFLFQYNWYSRNIELYLPLPSATTTNEMLVELGGDYSLTHMEYVGEEPSYNFCVMNIAHHKSF